MHTIANTHDIRYTTTRDQRKSKSEFVTRAVLRAASSSSQWHGPSYSFPSHLPAPCLAPAARASVVRPAGHQDRPCVQNTEHRTQNILLVATNWSRPLAVGDVQRSASSASVPLPRSKLRLATSCHLHSAACETCHHSLASSRHEP
jgi:hypothetical protein